MSIKINKNNKEYPLGFVPQSLYDDVEDLKNRVNIIVTEEDYTTDATGNAGPIQRKDKVLSIMPTTGVRISGFFINIYGALYASTDTYSGTVTLRIIRYQ